MSDIAKAIKTGYEAICQAPDGSEAAKRYVDYHHAMLGLPPLEAGQIAETVDHNSSLDISGLWGTQVRAWSDGTPKYFRGTGLVAVGATDGRILAVSDGPLSGTDEDLVGQADRYPDYRNYVPIFLGSAAMLKAMRVRGNYAMDRKAYERRGEVLLEAGIIQNRQAHHLGYLLSEFDDFTAGASGVLPSPIVAEYFAKKMAEKFEEDRQAGLLTWEHDTAAGFHDVMACDLALDLTEHSFPSWSGEPIHIDHLVSFADTRRNMGQNIH